MYVSPSPRSGELASEYEKKKAMMSQAAEETAFTYHKRRVSPGVARGRVGVSCHHGRVSVCYPRRA